MKILLVFSFLCLLGNTESQAEPPAAGALEIGRVSVDYGAAISPAGEYAKALFSPDEYPAEQRVVVSAAVTLENGSPVQELTLYLFPVGEEGPELILAAGDGLLTTGNPKATTDADGRLTFTTGPLWEFANRFTLGLLQQRSPDRPFDLAVLPLATEDVAATFQADTNQRKIDLGTITLIVSEPDTEAQ